MRALVFTEQSLLTALANDDGYQTAYETLTKLWAEPDDLLIAISSSGRSENILRAAAAMRDAGGRIITMSSQCTYSSMFTEAFTAIGFPNRLWL